MRQEHITNPSKFRSRERGLLLDLLAAWEKKGLPDEFLREVTAMVNGTVMNPNKTWVELIDSWKDAKDDSALGYAESLREFVNYWGQEWNSDGHVHMRLEVANYIYENMYDLGDKYEDEIKRIENQERLI